MPLRILHLSHTGLPDLRIEKTALTLKSDENELVFLGGRPFRYQNLDAFDQVHFLPIGNNLQIALNPTIKSKWLRTIDKIAPDIIHAHNIYVARFLLGSEYPVVYDDHEYWSVQSKSYEWDCLRRRITFLPAKFLIPNWERRVLEKYPTITTTENTAKSHRRICKWVGVTRNVPCLKQIEGIKPAENRNGLVYSGSDFKLERFLPFRNMTGLKKILDFEVIADLTHREMMMELTKYEIGLTPWLSHPWHPFSDANRNYEYLHAGLQVVVNSVIKSQFKNDAYVHDFTDYSDIVERIDSIKTTESHKIMEHAKRYYLWENQSDIIREAYRRA